MNNYIIKMSNLEKFFEELSNNPLIYEDKKDLVSHLANILNDKLIKIFNLIPSKDEDNINLVDHEKNIFMEVSTKNFSSAMVILLYKLAFNKIHNPDQLVVADPTQIRFYRPPSFDQILEFAMSIDRKIKKPPSSIQTEEYKEKAFNLVGDFYYFYTNNGIFFLRNLDGSLTYMCEKYF